MTNYVLEGLIKRRAWLAGEIENTHTKLKELIASLENLDATIVQFDPTYQVENIKPRAFRPPEDWAQRGEMSRMILSVLRQSVEPMTTRDIALELLATRALDKDDQRLLKLMGKRVGVALRYQRDNGLVKSHQGPGQYQLWEIKR